MSLGGNQRGLSQQLNKPGKYREGNCVGFIHFTLSSVHSDSCQAL